ncbi:uncharacterized protein LOC106156398 [Lingula anatina]|uniref:Uncharacterized protein LOC106156398 n=1 Tax=Lingula anatina TaxID=7574 RepID=A0A1S3HNH6_LINAN|nr:uncharacterized protein LOC106156398 [Lingula anatina]|eukprot:XP_013387081.1 uncharacterized protein LOC106156398 [Lingula anatina]
MADVKQDPKVLFRKIHQKAKTLGITGDHYDMLESVDYLRESKKPYWTIIFAVTVVISSVLLGVFLGTGWPLTNRTVAGLLYSAWGEDIEQEPCIFEINEFIFDIFRPPTNCDICRNITEVVRVSNLSQEEFERLYAYSGRPVVVTDGTANWTAQTEFSFSFFKNVYAPGSPVLESATRDCQFFPYQTSFTNLGEVFEMEDQRAQLKDNAEPWYIGWSNCDPMAANILRKHYSRPYFLPKLAESSKTDWIFMGSPGYGANMHIDNVGNPSWQAQITGTKRWTLEPPPECYKECVPRIEVVVKPGDIIVLDTNAWFHSTLIEGSDMSITIGSEFD